MAQEMGFHNAMTSVNDDGQRKPPSPEGNRMLRAWAYAYNADRQ